VGARGLRVGVTVVRRPGVRGVSRAGRGGGLGGGVGRRVTRPGESGARCGGSPCLGQGGYVSVVELLGLDGAGGAGGGARVKGGGHGGPEAGREGGQSGGVGRRVTRPGESGARCGGSPCLGQGGDVSVVELLGLDGAGRRGTRGRTVLKKSTHSKAATSTALMSRQGPLRLICFGLDPPDRGLGQGVYAPIAVDRRRGTSCQAVRTGRMAAQSSRASRRWSSPSLVAPR